MPQCHAVTNVKSEDIKEIFEVLTWLCLYSFLSGCFMWIYVVYQFNVQSVKIQFKKVISKIDESQTFSIITFTSTSTKRLVHLKNSFLFVSVLLKNLPPCKSRKHAKFFSPLWFSVGYGCKHWTTVSTIYCMIRHPYWICSVKSFQATISNMCYSLGENILL